MRHDAGKLPVACLLLLTAYGCSAPDDNSETASQPATTDSRQAGITGSHEDHTAHVIESFEVGRQVYVRSLVVEPKKHSLWVGTSVGVHEIDLSNQQVLNTFTRDDGLANEYVFAMMVDQQGNKWFGTNGGGATRYKDHTWKTFFPMHGLADYWVYAFNQQSDGTVWIGTWAGANRYDPVNNRFITYYDELVNEWVYGIGVDSTDRVWFGTEGGISMYDGENWRSWTHKDGLGAPNTDNLPLSNNTGLGTRARHNLSVLNGGQPTYNPNYVFCITVADDDTVWAGTWGGGVSHFADGEWHNLTTSDGLAGNIVFSMTQDQDGAFWFGTEKGLSRYDGTSWQTIGREQGLLGESVYAVASTPEGEIWAGTLGGVTRVGY